MDKKSKIVDLVVSEDGSYSPEGIKTKSTKVKAVSKPKSIEHNKPKYIQSNEVDEFLAGMDVGLDLIDNILPRVNRILKLRG